MICPNRKTTLQGRLDPIILKPTVIRCDHPPIWFAVPLKNAEKKFALALQGHHLCVEFLQLGFRWSTDEEKTAVGFCLLNSKLKPHSFIFCTARACR